MIENFNPDCGAAESRLLYISGAQWATRHCWFGQKRILLYLRDLGMYPEVRARRGVNLLSVGTS